ncbi:MAG TPA: iron ABC transporter permease [Kaistia sp.]|nr:iron ABC transporter permease [Kaistia sp.]
MASSDAAAVAGGRLSGPNWRRLRIPLVLTIAGLASLGIMAAGTLVGTSGVSLAGIGRAILIGVSGAEIPADFAKEYRIVWNLRFPRVLLGFLGGASLSLAGVLMQGLLRNPLVSPFTLGVSPAAAFGAALVIIMTQASGAGTGGLEVAAALVSALGCAALVLGFGSFRRLSPTTLILLGIALTQLFEALTSGLQYFASEDALSAIVRWTFGSVNDAQWYQVQVLFALLVLSLPYLLLKAKDINAIAFTGDDVATSLGVNVPRVRIVIIAISVVLTAVVVSFSGVIGFVGLVGPHIARLIIGGNHRYLIPLATLTGGCLLVTADMVGRIVLAPVVVPVGIVIALIGVPIFINLVLSRRGAT